MISEYSQLVLWTFTRDGRHLRVEIAHAEEAGHYRILLTRPDHTVATETLAQPSHLVDRAVTVMDELRHDGWHLT